MKPWLRVFDGGEPRSTEQQLCLLRDCSLRAHSAWVDWKDNKGDEGFERRLDDAIRPLFKACEQTDVFLSGFLTAINKEQESG